MLARPEVQLSGRAARGVVLVANDVRCQRWKRRDGRDLRYGIHQYLHRTRRPTFVRCGRSPGYIGRGAQCGCWSVTSWSRAGSLPSFAFSAPPARGLLLGCFGGFRSRKAPPPRSWCLCGRCTWGLGRLWASGSAALLLVVKLGACLGHTQLRYVAFRALF